jgi:hypothetical protein
MRVVALKALATPLAASGTARQRFAREARAAAAVRDDHVVAIHAVCDEAPVPYLVMELIDGCNLEALLRRGGPLEVKEVLRIGTQVASGLAAAHKQGLVHRDIKPANVLLENGVQRVKLTDFGLARAADDASLTQSGLIAGTPLYMAPEQAAGEPIDARADLFSLGSVLYEMCTGRPAFRAPTTVAVIRRVCDEAPRPIHQVNPDVPGPLCRLIERLHAKRPADRPASAAEVADLLTGMLAGLQGQGSASLSSADAGPPAPPRRTGSSRPWLWAAAALVVLFVGLGVGEATGVTDVRGTVIRLFSPEGTLVVEVDDPNVSVSVDGGEVVITGAGAREIRLKPGRYKVEASKDGKVVRQELVTVTRNGREVVKVGLEPPKDAVTNNDTAWEKATAALPPEKQVEAVLARLKERNPAFDPVLARHAIEGAAVREFVLNTTMVRDLRPLRAFAQLRSLSLRDVPVSDLSPLRGLPLESLDCYHTRVTDLAPLRGMKLRWLVVSNTGVSDLSPLAEMPLEHLECAKSWVDDLTPLAGMKLKGLQCSDSKVVDLGPLKNMPLSELRAAGLRITDLEPLRGMSLTVLFLDRTDVSDLTPLKGMKLTYLTLERSKVVDLSPLEGFALERLSGDFDRERDGKLLRSFPSLREINWRPAAEFWKGVDGK